MLKPRSKKKFSGQSGILLFTGLSILCLLSLTRFVYTSKYMLIDIFSHFPVQYALMAAFFSAICFRRRKPVLALFAGILFFINISVLMEGGNTAQAAVTKNNPFTVYSVNIEKSNTDFSKLNNFLMETDADILLLLEVTAKHVEPLQAVVQSYPYRIINLNTGSSGTGTVLMSRFPIVERSVTKYSEFGNMLVTAKMEIAGRNLTFYAAHFPRPGLHQEFSERLNQFISLAQQVDRKSDPVIVAGDFNATPFSPIFRKLLKISGLRDSREGFGWLPSWPSYLPLCWIPIDHILVSPDIQVNRRATGPDIGSDHYPVFAELSLL